MVRKIPSMLCLILVFGTLYLPISTVTPCKNMDTSTQVQIQDISHLYQSKQMNINQKRSQSVLKVSSEDIEVEWEKFYGEIEDEWAHNLIHTSDGGYVIAGSSYDPVVGDEDFLIMKFDEDGDLVFNRLLGTTDEEGARSIIETSDQGFALIGTTRDSIAGDTDLMLVKTDQYGVKQWIEVYGTFEHEQGSALLQTKDGGYLLAGTIQDPEFNEDYWILKVDKDGLVEWEKHFGTTNDDTLWALTPTQDNGFVLVGTSMDDEESDIYLIKINQSGEIQWGKLYNTINDDRVYAAVLTTDGGFALAGSTTTGDDASKENFWLLKVNSEGFIEWGHYYGTGFNDTAWSVIQTKDGGFALAGHTDSGNGVWDALVVQTDANGEVKWIQSFGSVEDDWTEAIVQTTDGFIVVGSIYDSDTNDYDIWLQKLVVPLPPIVTVTGSKIVTPKTSEIGLDTQWDTTYGKSEDDWARALIPTSNGGFVVAGSTYDIDAGDEDFLVAIFNKDGELQYDQIMGTFADDAAWDIIETSDQGFALIGTTIDSSTDDSDVLIMKTDQYGVMQWYEVYGTFENEQGRALLQTDDGGFLLAGSTHDPELSDEDFWLLKVTADGKLEWESNYGTMGDDTLWDLVKTFFGFALIGTTDISGNTDIWIVHTDQYGIFQWEKQYGSIDEDHAYAATQTVDWGLAIAGSTNDHTNGDDDFWLLKVDSSGEIEWNQFYGTYNNDVAWAIIETEDWGFVLAGYTEIETGIWDALLVKTNNKGIEEWSQTFDVMNADNWAAAIIETNDNELLFAGSSKDPTSGDYDFWIVKAEISTKPPSDTAPVSGMSAVIGLAGLGILGIWRKKRRL